MGLRERFRSGGTASLSTARWALLVGSLVVAVSLVAVVMQPGDQVGPVNPQAEWTWSETVAGDVALTHEGGDSIDRGSLSLIGDGLAEPVSDLGDGDDGRLVQPFGDGVVSRGDSLVIDGGGLENGSVVLYWRAPDGEMSATLTQLDYPDDFERRGRDTRQGWR